jgi:hypothetical protein
LSVASPTRCLALPVNSSALFLALSVKLMVNLPVSRLVGARGAQI